MSSQFWFPPPALQFNVSLLMWLRLLATGQLMVVTIRGEVGELLAEEKLLGIVFWLLYRSSETCCELWIPFSVLVGQLALGGTIKLRLCCLANCR